MAAPKHHDRDALIHTGESLAIALDCVLRQLEQEDTPKLRVVDHVTPAAPVARWRRATATVGLVLLFVLSVLLGLFAY